MRRKILLILGIMLVTAAPLRAATFTHKPIAPDLGVDVFTRDVAQQMVGRQLFGSPYATVTLSNVDLYDRFPYVEARHFQIVSDPSWNRLVLGEMGQDLTSFDGSGTSLGALSGPRGMAVDENNRVYVADAGNDRIVVLQASTEFGSMTLQPLFAITGLSRPFDVAYSDGGTPFVSGDDFLYVANTGRNAVQAYSLSASGARRVAEIGDLGSGPGRFAGPMAITVGRSNGVNTRDIFVADAHNQRIVHLHHDASGLTWLGDASVGATVVTSLDTDQFGNVYAAAPQDNVVRKFSPTLEPVASLSGVMAHPRAVHIPFFNVNDHRSGAMTRVGQPNVVSLDDWAPAGGVRLWQLGVGIDGLGVVGGDLPVAHFTLTDQASVTLEIDDATDGHRLATRGIGSLGAGVHDVALTATDLRGAASASPLLLRVSAASPYSGSSAEVAQASFQVIAGGGVALPSRAQLLGNWPNPAQPTTRIGFVLPASGFDRTSLTVFDAAGRRVRSFNRAFNAGLNQVDWDGTDDSGRSVRAGLYFYRLDVGHTSQTRRFAVVR